MFMHNIGKYNILLTNNIIVTFDQLGPGPRITKQAITEVQQHKCNNIGHMAEFTGIYKNDLLSQTLSDISKDPLVKEVFVYI